MTFNTPLLPVTNRSITRSYISRWSCSQVVTFLLLVGVLVLYHVRTFASSPQIPGWHGDEFRLYQSFDVHKDGYTLQYVDIPFCTDNASVLEHLMTNISEPFACKTYGTSRNIKDRSRDPFKVQPRIGDVACDRDTNEPWLVSRYTPGRPCGTLPTHSSFPSCRSGNSVNTSFVITSLCHPVARFIREFEGREELRDAPFYQVCEGNPAPKTEPPDCYRSATLSEFTECSRNPAANRLSRMLYTGPCAIPSLVRGSTFSEDVMNSAKQAVQVMNFVGVEEVPYLSTQLFTHVFPDILVRSLPSAAPPPASYLTSRYPAEVIRQVVAANSYDIALYYTGLRTFRGLLQLHGIDPSALDLAVEANEEALGFEPPTNLEGVFDASLEYFLANKMVFKDV